MAFQEGNPLVIGAGGALVSIKMSTFKITAGVFFALSFLSVLGRAGLRIHAKRKPSTDDYLVFLGCSCLIAGTGVLYANCDSMYLTQALLLHPDDIYSVDRDELATAATKFYTLLVVTLSLLWTAIFAVKFSFLAFFWQLVQSMNMDNMRRYYWFVVAVTALSWVFALIDPFLICPHFGLDNAKCSTSFFRRPTLTFVLTGFLTGLDAGTDLMIVSIPILVLGRTKMKTHQKAAIGSFLCLSLVMVAMAIARVKQVHGSTVRGSFVYELFWTFLEAAVALFMASLTSYRTFFVLQKERTRYREVMRRRSFSLKGLPFRKRAYDEEMQLPEVPRATLTGMRSFIRRNDRTTTDSSMICSVEEVDMQFAQGASSPRAQ